MTRAVYPTEPDDYSEKIDSRLTELLFSQTISTCSVYAKMLGTWPAAVSERLSALERGRMQIARIPTNLENSTEYKPELHPLNFEWYFTKQTTTLLVKELLSQRETTICLGTPTIAAASPISSEVRLFDSNHLILDRFFGFLNTARVLIGDVSEALKTDQKADLVIFDAPWYAKETIRWLAIASKIVRPGGRIAFSLFPRLVRPGADTERQNILTLAEAIGSVEECPGGVGYETPLFERVALSCRGIGNIGNWRRGDLVTIRVRNKCLLSYTSLQRDPLLTDTWKTCVVDGQVIKIKQSATSTDDEPDIFPLSSSSHSYIYDAVSARDLRRQEIDLWTSRNRVAKIRNPVAITSIFEKIAAGEPLQRAIEAVCYRSAKRDKLLKAIFSILSAEPTSKACNTARRC